MSRRAGASEFRISNFEGREALTHSPRMARSPLRARRVRSCPKRLRPSALLPGPQVKEERKWSPSSMPEFREEFSGLLDIRRFDFRRFDFRRWSLTIYSLATETWWPWAWRRAWRLASSRSWATISAHISSTVISGTHPSFSFAFVGSPRRVSTSAGRK